MASNTNKPKVALIYDFDKTLSTRDMQEYSLIPMFDMTPEEFWGRSKSFNKNNAMDKNLAYMWTILSVAKEKGISLTRDSFVKMGKDVEFYPGVSEWFDNVNGLGEGIGVEVEHYIISSGLKEMIEGTPIAKYFKSIFACEYLYDDNGAPCWVKNVINYTTKTQFLFRINKDALDISDEEKVNEFIYQRDREVPFENMIYFGDGSTDIPCMKLVHVNGGHSIAVYANDKMKKDAEGLYKDHRVAFMENADYSKEGSLYGIVSDVMNLVKYLDNLYRRSEGYGIVRKDYSK